MDKSVSLIIPAYNEENGIGGVLDRLLEDMEGSGLTYEIIVVDDGSRDGTAAALAPYEGAITLLRHPENKGYGASLKTGIRRARYELICITDADGTYPNERIPELVEHMATRGDSMVVGARTGEHVAIPLIRRPAKWVLGRLANFVASQHIPDLNSGLRVFERAVALRMFNILPDKFSFTTTITLAMLTNGYPVSFVPINYHARIGSSKIRPIHDTLNFLQLVMRIALYFAPLKVFFPLSLFTMLLAGGWALFTKFKLGQLADVSTLVIFLTAVQIGTLGMLAELINRRLPNYYREE